MSKVEKRKEKREKRKEKREKRKEKRESFCYSVFAGGQDGVRIGCTR